jgi:multiple sugar transport system permease protein
MTVGSSTMSEWVPAAGKTPRGAWKKRCTPYVLLAPSLLLFVGILIYPLAYSLYLSLHSYQLGAAVASAKFIGVANYLRLLEDPQFRNSLAIGLSYVGWTTAVNLVLGMALALAFARRVRGIGLIRGLAILPMMFTPVAVGLVFRLLFNSLYGWFNHLLGLVGIPPQAFAADPVQAFWVIVFVESWRHVPFMMLMFLAGLAALPKEPYEAASIDGARAWQSFLYVTLPLLRPLIALAVLIRGMDSLRQFDQIFALTHGGPGGATEVLSLYIYRITFGETQLGLGLAASWVMILLTVAGSVALTKLVYRRGEV